MKYLSLMVVVAIVYLVATQMRSSNSGVKSSIARAEEEAAKVEPRKMPASQPGATPAPVSLRAPIQRAEQLKTLVKQRNGGGEF